MNPVQSRQQVEEIIESAIRSELDDVIVLDVQVRFTSDIAQKLASIKIVVDFYDDGSEAVYYIKPDNYKDPIGLIVHYRGNPDALSNTYIDFMDAIQRFIVKPEQKEWRKYIITS